MKNNVRRGAPRKNEPTKEDAQLERPPLDIVGQLQALIEDKAWLEAENERLTAQTADLTEKLMATEAKFSETDAASVADQLEIAKHTIAILSAADTAHRHHIAQLETSLDQDELVARVQTLETWMYSIAERLRIKASNASSTMGAINDAIRKLSSR